MQKIYICKISNKFQNSYFSSILLRIIVLHITPDDQNTQNTKPRTILWQHGLKKEFNKFQLLSRTTFISLKCCNDLFYTCNLKAWPCVSMINVMIFIFLKLFSIFYNYQVQKLNNLSGQSHQYLSV
jgi:hypothetical protein